MPSRGHTTASLPCHSSSPQTLPPAPLNTEVGGGGGRKASSREGLQGAEEEEEGKEARSGGGEQRGWKLLRARELALQQ